ncbi:FTR1 family iron permease [Chitinimonas sp.]|uniref:FTR1 family iron permease n=1 Tax=Chitinimonas sp. TaxID=1934313 RepID=UPI002F91BFD6
MLATALIVFREILEAALVVSIILAATRGVPRRGTWVGIGLAAGAAGAGLIAVFAEAIANWAQGMGQELFNAGIMFLAVAMLAWHSIWMGRHGREMAQALGAVGKAVADGSRSLPGLAVVVGIALLREGAEAILFLYGIAVGEPGQPGSMIIGALLGATGGVAVGATLYLGLLQIPTHRLFSVTNALVIVLAAGMASQGVGYLISAGWLPSWGEGIWDSSWLLSERSVPGKMLHALVGYTDRPAGIQVAVYLATLLSITLLMRRLGKPALAKRQG